MYESKREPGKKFGSIYAGKRFDSYASSPQPGEENANEHAEPKRARELDAEPKDASVPKNEHAEDASVETPEATVASHGAAHTVHYSHGEDGTHTVSSEHGDGHVTESKHTSAAEAYGHGKALAFEAGGDEQATDVKKREHNPQQGAESEERNYEMPDLA